MSSFCEWIDWLIGRSISHAQLVEEKEMLLTSIEEEKRKVKSLENDIANLSCNQTKCNSEMGSMSDLLIKKDMEKERLHGDYQALEEQLRSTEDNLNDNKIILEGVQKELEEMKGVQKELEEMKGVQKDLEEMKISNEKLKGEKDAMEKRLSDIQLQYNTLLGEQQTLKKNYETLEQRKSMMEKVLCEKEMSVSSLEEMNTELEMSLSSLKAENAKLEFDYATLQKKDAELSASVVKLEQELDNKSGTKTTKAEVEPSVQCAGGNVVENPAES